MREERRGRGAAEPCCRTRRWMVFKPMDPGSSCAWPSTVYTLQQRARQDGASHGKQLGADVPASWLCTKKAGEASGRPGLLAAAAAFCSHAA